MGILILTLSSISQPSSAPQLLVITLEGRALKNISLHMYIIYVYVYCRYFSTGCNCCGGSKCLYCHRILLLDWCVARGWPDWHTGQVWQLYWTIADKGRWDLLEGVRLGA